MTRARRYCVRLRRAAALSLLATSAAFAETGGEPTSLERVRSDIGRLEQELARLAGRERGILGELERLGAERRLRETELREVTLRLSELEQRIGATDVRLGDLREAQARRREYLAFRLRELYKAGPERSLWRVFSGAEVDRLRRALNYAAYLSQRDAEVLAAFRASERESSVQQESLAHSRRELAATVEQLEQAAQRLATSEVRQSRALSQIRLDQQVRQTALAELQGAASEMGQWVGTLGSTERATALDIRQFRGLLDLPADGPVTAEFGTVVHPRFQTRVPHPGWDIAAPFGSKISCVFDGRVAYADWMRGYGLTIIVDHGSGVVSISAHASALVVAAGDLVQRGQTLGFVGDTGSLQGPLLYFELRVDGAPADPAQWLRAAP